MSKDYSNMLAVQSKSSPYETAPGGDSDKENIAPGASLTSPPVTIIRQKGAIRARRQALADKSAILNSASTGSAANSQPSATKLPVKEIDLVNQLEQAKRVGLRYHNLLYGPIWNQEPKSIQRLIKKLNVVLSENFLTFNELIGPVLAPEMKFETIRDVFEVLEESGFLFPNVLEQFRAVEITKIALEKTFTAARVYQMNLRNLLTVFNKPNSWNALVELNLAKCPLENQDLLKIHHLPTLKILNVAESGISDNSICHLVALQSSLRHLDISGNPKVTDLCVFPLTRLQSLESLFLHETGVTMDGLREVCRAAYEIVQGANPRIFSYVKLTQLVHFTTLSRLTIPTLCLDYIWNRQRYYVPFKECAQVRDISTGASGLLKEKNSPMDPELGIHPNWICVVCDPQALNNLNLASLQVQLNLHKNINPNISVRGTRQDCLERLSDLLRKRLGDESIARILKMSHSID